jgi:PTH2 family peptidyl-tRNA hydrolase
MSDVKQVILVRRDLSMPTGKIASQVAHASLAAILSRSTHTDAVPETNTPEMIHLQLTPVDSVWYKERFTKVVLGVGSEKELLQLYNQAKAKGLLCSIIQDAGHTVFNGVPTYTTVAIGPALADDIDSVTGNLRLL